MSDGTRTALAVVLVVVVAAAASSLLRPLLRAILRALSRRGLAGATTRWRLRVPRLFEESDETAELRRLQRVDAAATMLSRVGIIGLWITVALLVLQILGTNAVLVVSGAGFLGAALAIGGQHSVNDYLTGLLVLLEDRFGEGDHLRVRVGDREVEATVARLGAFTVRLESDTATWHVANRELFVVENLSQAGVVSMLEAPAVAQGASTRELQSALRASYEATEEWDPTRDGLVLDRVEQVGSRRVRLVLRTARPLSSVQRGALIEGLER